MSQHEVGRVVYVGWGWCRPSFNEEPPIGLPFEVSRGAPHPLFRVAVVSFVWAALWNIDEPPGDTIRTPLQPEDPLPGWWPTPNPTLRPSRTPDIIHRLTITSLSPNNDLPFPPLLLLLDGGGKIRHTLLYLWLLQPHSLNNIIAKGQVCLRHGKKKVSAVAERLCRFSSPVSPLQGFPSDC